MAEAQRRDGIYLFLILCLLPLASAATITAPTGDIQAATLPTTIDLAWQANGSATVVLVGNQTIINTTTDAKTLQATLPQGTYQLTVNDSASTDQRTFAVERTPIALGLTTDKQTYLLGDMARLQASSSTPTPATLILTKDGAEIERYSLSISGSVDLFYVVEQTGTYTATLTAEGAQAQAHFVGEQPAALSIDFSYTQTRINSPVVFTASASGGTPPYTYQWLFSDDTTSSGQESTHYFFTAEQHSATLIVTDAAGTQTSTTKSFSVTHRTHDIEITVRNKDGTLLEDLDVALEGLDNQSDEEERTDEDGTVEFNDVRGRYRITITQLDATYHNETRNISKDESILYTIDYALPIQNRTTNQTEPAYNDTATVAAAEPAPAETAITAQEALEAQRTTHLDTLSERRFSLQLSAKKDAALKHLELYGAFDRAERAIEDADSEEEMLDALAQAPAKVEILDEQSRISYPDPQAQAEMIDAFLNARGVADEKLKETYRKNIERIAQNASIRTETTRLTITTGEQEKTYTIVKREITAPSDTYAVEVIDKGFAQNVADLRIDGRYQVLEEDPVLKFTESTYAYSAQTGASAPQPPVLVPEELVEASLLSGLVSFAIGEGDATRNIIYLVILGIFIGGLVAGTKLRERQQGRERFETFSALADEALTRLGAGDEGVIEIIPEIHGIYEELPAQQRAALADIMDHLSTRGQASRFLGEVETAYGAAQESAGDINVISAAYERALAAYEELPAGLQEEMRGHLRGLDEYLDGIIKT